MKKIIFFLIISTCINSLSQTDTINLFYDIGDYKLNESNHTVIDNYLTKLNDSSSYNIKIISSADFVGSTSKNDELSKKRADYIKDLLIKKNKAIFKSFKVISIGEIPNNKIVTDLKKGVFKHRKTSIIFNETGKTDIVKINNFDILKLGDKVALKNLIFKTGKAKLKENSYQTLKELVNYLNENPNVEIEIAGHICCGNDFRNPQSKKIIKYKASAYYGSDLSANRAEFVYSYLIKNGIKKERLEYYGYGFQLPLYFPEKTIQDKIRNKRVEIKINKI